MDTLDTQSTLSKGYLCIQYLSHGSRSLHTALAAHSVARTGQRPRRLFARNGTRTEFAGARFVGGALALFERGAGPDGAWRGREMQDYKMNEMNE